MKRSVAILFLLFSLAGKAQIAPGKYFVSFTDKNNNPYSVSSPSAFLSQRAINRRNAQSINITTQDLPVTPAYVDSVIAQGATVLNKTKWLNGVVIQTTDTNVLNSIEALPFVSGLKILHAANSTLKKDFVFLDKMEKPAAEKMLTDISPDEYGPALGQTQMINCDFLHNIGYTGTGMLIAVLDAGFIGANTIPAFQNMINENRLLATHDFVEGDSNVFAHSSHGTSVLSCMAAQLPGFMIGTAPDASYILLRTEDAASEFIVEEYNWASGAEYADSAGADVFNTSLGYTTFNDPLYNHTYADMNGDSAVITIAADIAASKGILVVNSAGNSGGTPWNYIGAPADGDSVLTVGAVDSHEVIANFSSHGPSFDGRVKPNVCTQGQGTFLAFDNGTFGYSGGTSFSSPIMAGAAACLWQARPGFNNMQIFHAIEQSADRYNHPDTLYGYGIPDMMRAWTLLNGALPPSEDAVLDVYPNPFSTAFSITFYTPQTSSARLEIFDAAGKKVYDRQNTAGRYYQSISINNSFAKGVYFLRLTTDTKVFYRKVVRQ
jgi:serine protease AprX